MQKVRAEFLEKEKGHWRSVAVAHEAEEWERKQKADAAELIAFLELERRFAVECASRASLAPPTPAESPAIPTAPAVMQTLAAPPQKQANRDVTPDGPPSLALHAPYRTPAKQTSRGPVDFGDEAEKENAAPAPGPGPVADAPKTPVTMDRAAALAAIEYRRNRARSFMAAQTTPRAAAGVMDKRDMSAPAMVTMSVGRRKGT